MQVYTTSVAPYTVCIRAHSNRELSRDQDWAELCRTRLLSRCVRLSFIASFTANRHRRLQCTRSESPSATHGRSTQLKALTPCSSCSVRAAAKLISTGHNASCSLLAALYIPSDACYTSFAALTAPESADQICNPRKPPPENMRSAAFCSTPLPSGCSHQRRHSTSERRATIPLCRRSRSPTPNRYALVSPFLRPSQRPARLHPPPAMNPPTSGTMQAEFRYLQAFYLPLTLNSCKGGAGVVASARDLAASSGNACALGLSLGSCSLVRLIPSPLHITHGSPSVRGCLMNGCPCGELCCLAVFLT